MDALDPAAVIRESAERRARLFGRPYDPLTGDGSYGARIELAANDHARVLLPAAMLDDDEARPFVLTIAAAGTVERVPQRLGLTPDEATAWFTRLAALRAKHDPEFWFASGVRIRTKRDGMVPFVLNPSQRGLLRLLMDDYLAGVPIRLVLVKARQWGGSTLVQLFMAWVQQMQRTGWNSLIVAHLQQASVHIRTMYRTMARFYPRGFGAISMLPYGGQQNVRFIPERECIVGVGSAKQPDGARSFTYHMLHLSEVGLWKSTPEQSAEDLAQALEGGLVQGEGTMCVLESTAKGVGNYFHQMYESAKEGKGSYRQYFVGWHQINDYTRPVAERDAGDFVRSWSAYERWLWMEGATIEGIAWYRRKLEDPPMKGDAWRMKQEYPTTADEAFVATGRRVFEPDRVAGARAMCRTPALVCDIKGEAMKGERALERLRFVPSDHGSLRIWRRPSDNYGGLLDLDRNRVRERFAAFLDIGGRWSGADWFVLTVLDRAPMLWGAPPELAAEWRAHRDQDLAAWEAVQVCTAYGRAYLAVEKNSVKRRHTDPEASDSPHHATILDEISEVYGDRLFHTVDPADSTGEKVTKWGFATTSTSKPMIINALNAALRDEGYVERERAALDEMDLYEVKDDGSYGARQGKGNHDDRVMSRAGAVWLATQYMDAVTLLPKQAKDVGRKAATGAAVF